MFRNDALEKPKKLSLFCALIVAIAVYFSSQWSPYIGYFLALLTMILIGFASHSVWPTRKRPENPFVFSLFWGLIIGLVIPYLITKIMTEGFESIIDLVMS